VGKTKFPFNDRAEIMRQLSLLLLALFWTWFMFAFATFFGQDSGDGASTMQKMYFTILMSLPLWVGVFTANHRLGWACYLRRASAVTILVCGAIFLLLSILFLNGLSVSGALMPLMIVVILFWPEISQQPIHPTPEQQQQLDRVRRWNWLIAAAIAPIIIWWGLSKSHNPPPKSLLSDEEMILNFNEHRSELEQLVQGYRNDRRPKKSGTFYYAQSLEAQSLMKKASVSAPNVSGDWWFPNPYSARATKFHWKIDSHSADPKVRPLLHSPEDWKREMPELFKGVPPITDYIDLVHHTGVMTLDFGNPDSIVRIWHGMRISRYYYHYPYPPKIQDSHILQPYYTKNGEPLSRPSERVLESLDKIPSDWEKGECILRRINPNWFIAMC
jgi:hypothetical protein